LHRPDLQQFVFDKNGGVRAFSEQGKSGSASENTKDQEFDFLSEDKWMFTLRWIHIRPRGPARILVIAATKQLPVRCGSRELGFYLWE
jgi:hypothetical protein